MEEMTPKEAVRRQVVINENRQDLTPFEKAKGYKLAWDTGYFKSDEFVNTLTEYHKRH